MREKAIYSSSSFSASITLDVWRACVYEPPVPASRDQTARAEPPKCILARATIETSEWLRIHGQLNMILWHFDTIPKNSF